MHLLLRERRTLDEAEPAAEPELDPTDLVLLSFSEADLAVWAAGWDREPALGRLASLGLGRLARLRHPMSVDLLVERIIPRARLVLVRLLGGIEAWRYGIDETEACCKRLGIPLVLLSGEGAFDDALARRSTVPRTGWERLDGFLREPGPQNVAAGLRLCTHLAGLASDDGAQPVVLPQAGRLDLGLDPGQGPAALILFYRSHLVSDDIAPIEALARALAARGLAPHALHVSSLRAPEAQAFVAAEIARLRPAVVLNATAFAAPIPDADVPVLQLVLASSTEAGWADSFRGLSQTDLAMQVVLPELEGRLLTTAISFKQTTPPVGRLGFRRTINAPHAAGIELAADRASGWARLAAEPRASRRFALILSDYPGVSGEAGHAVGLDSFASLRAILADLAGADYDIAVPPDDLAHALTTAPPARFLSLADYTRLLTLLPEPARLQLLAEWGEPASDPDLEDGWFVLRHLRLGCALVALQPDRGAGPDRRSLYHDPDRPPRHGFVAFHLWLREQLRIHAMVHVGTHGCLEWLPGKALAPSETCWTALLARGLPVLYPFIVNNPGEAAVAKRRLGAVTIGHLTPPLRRAGDMLAEGDPLRVLERLIDDFASADGLDQRRTRTLRGEILARAGELGLLAESGADQAPGDDEALQQLDAWLCDVKDLQLRCGLHVFGRPAPERDALLAAIQAESPGADGASLALRLDASPARECDALLAGLDGRFVAPGPAGAPSRGRPDVLPTGRNLCAIDPRTVPTRAAMVLARRLAAGVLDRHHQEQGDWLRSLLVDLWGSTCLRTGGEDLGLAFVLMGVEPVWDEASGRIRGVEILPQAVLDRPRVDVTLRVSGLFRDLFPEQMRLFDEAVQLVAGRTGEDPALNPLAGSGELRPLRLFGPAAGAYGAGEGAFDLSRTADAIGRDYLAASQQAYAGAQTIEADEGAFARRVAASEALVHLQDHAETDLLDSPDYALHEGGFAAAANLLASHPRDASPAVYHADTSRPQQLVVRTAAEEIRRVVRGRLANRAWIATMCPHGYRGAAEIARGLGVLDAWARSLPERFDRQYELVFAATLGDEPTDAFLRHANPDAWARMQQIFAAAREAGRWRSASNRVALLLDRR